MEIASEKSLEESEKYCRTANTNNKVTFSQSKIVGLLGFVDLVGLSKYRLSME